MRLELSHFIESDLTTIGDFIARHNPRRAETFVQELVNEIERVGREPFAFRLRPEIGKDARAAVYGSYLILFRIHGEVVRIERVVHGGRQLAKLFP